MTVMTARERAQTAIAHREPDRIPIDLGSHGASVIRPEVYDGVRALWGIPEGGYVLAPGHYIQSEVPPENVVPMFEAAAELGAYPVR